MDNDLSERYNDGLVPAPDLAGEPARLQRPAWQPTPAQLEAARKQLTWRIAVLALLVFVCLIFFELPLSWWRP